MSNMVSLLQLGQSMWLDYLDRDRVINGRLKILVEAGLRGVTSNPTIFHRALANSQDYDAAILDLIQADPQIDEATLYEWLTLQDTQLAADILHPVYLASEGADGYVSLEVAPGLAYDRDGTIEAVRHLWKAVNRENLMIKVPGTREGLAAIEQLVAEGININVTLLFSVERYAEVMDAYTRGLARNPAPHRATSVASFFVSRIDTKVDAALDANGTEEAKRLRGRIAIANAKVAYQRFKALVEASPFAEQRARGARVQRLLWGSTSTKDPHYSDVFYVENLIGPATVVTVPQATLDAFQHHGRVRETLEDEVGAAHQDLADLAALGVDLARLTRELEEEGVAAFVDAYNQTLALLKEKCYTLTKDYAMR